METFNDSEIMEMHIPCESCGSSDGACLYSDGHTYCFVCQKVTKGRSGVESMVTKRHKVSNVIPQASLVLQPLKARGITRETCAKYGYYMSRVKDESVQVANYVHEGTVVAQKVRWADKSFMTFGKMPDIFFGQNLFHGGKKLVVVEGEIDALSLSQAQGNKYPVVSIPKGSQGAKKVFSAQLAWLESFDEVITMFDMDEPGREATKSVQGLLSPGKLKEATIPLKDANEMLKAGRVEELLRAVWNAETYRPDGIVQGKDLFEATEKLLTNEEGIPLPWNIPANEMIKGIRTSELTMVTAGSGIGKTTFCRAIGHFFGTQKNIKVGCVFLEESPARTAQGLMSCTAHQPLHITGENLSVDDRKQIFAETFDSGNFVMYDHFGSIEGDNLISQIRYLAVAEGCKFVILDHISIAISGLEGENERRIIDNLMTKLAALTQETGVGIIAISHLRKADAKGKSHEEGGKISLDDLRGSGALKQLSFTILALERNQQAESAIEKNIIRVRVLKCRYTGDTGVGGYLWYDKKTNTFTPIDDVEAFIEQTEEELAASYGFKIEKPKEEKKGDF